MLFRVNAVVHAVSALYAFITLGISEFIVQPLIRSNSFVLALSGIFILGVFDVIAALKQWRRPASGRMMSIGLHLGVAVIVIAVVTAAYHGGPERHSFKWFIANDFAFVSCLAILRLALAVKLLGWESGRQK